MKRLFGIFLAAVICITCLLCLTPKTEAAAFFNYTVSGGKATITEYVGWGVTNLVIPDTLDGYPVTTIGSSAFEDCDSLASVIIPDSVTTIGKYAFYKCTSLQSVTIPDSVTTIGNYAFEGCNSLTGIWVDANNPSYSSDTYGVFFNKDKTELIQAPGAISGGYTIPNSVTTIDKYAFYNCTSLQSVIIPDSVTTIGDNTFAYCDSLQSVTIGDSVTAIGSYVFYSCSSLQSVTIPDSVTTIGDSAFYNCNSLTSVTIGDSVTTIASSAFRNCSNIDGIRVDQNNLNYSSDDRGVLFNKNKSELLQAPGKISGNYIIPDSVTTIGWQAFYRCNSLQSITIPDSVTTIGNYAFYSCSSLQSVTIPDSVTTMGEQAFYNCNSLTSVTIGDSVTTIGYHAFFGCSSLQSITIPDSVTTIGSYAFSSCSNLQSVTIPDSVTTIGSSAFHSCSSLQSVTILDSVTTIGDYAFYNCSSLQSIIILDSVTTIGDYAFYNCSRLQSVTIGDSVTTIGDYAFYNCSRLQSITIPDSVTTIDFYTFSHCTSLQSVTIPDSVTTISYYAFNNCYKLTNVYYAGSQSQWQNIKIRNGNDPLTSAMIHYNHIHDYTLIPPAAQVEPGCTENGYIDHTCIYGETMREILPALGHISGSDTTVVAPTCTNQGYTISTCTRCGEQVRTDYTSSLGHDFSGTVTVVAPTCTQQGYTITQCTRCTATKNYDYTDELGHKLVYVAPVDATCTTPNKTYGTKCERCDYWGVQQTVGTSLGHSFTNYISDNNATCTTYGTETAKCDRCEEIHTQIDYNSKLGHNFTNYISDNNATIFADGTKTAQCDRCSATDTITDPGTKLIGGTCGDELIWTLGNEGTLTISGTGAMDDYNADWESPWQSVRSEITSVVIEKGVTHIGKYAFAVISSSTGSCASRSAGIGANGGFVSRDGDKLAKITIPVSVTSIGDYAFANCTALTTVIYGGTKAQWNSIAIGTGNEALLNANILYIGEMKFASAAPGLYNDIAMYYTLDKTNLDALGITNPYLVVTFNGKETVITDYTVSADGTQYTFGFFNIAPNQMGDTITATLYATYGDGVYEGATLNYSVALYCTRMLNNSAVVNNAAYAELRTLLVDLLNYGAAAQVYTGYKTDSLVNKDLTATQKAWGTSTTPELTSKTAITNRIQSPVAGWKTAILVLDDSVTIRLIFSATDVSGMSMKITTDANPDGWVISQEDFVYDSENNYYYVDFGELHAGQMRQCIYATVYSGDTAVSHTLRYSIESYAASFAANTDYPAVAELVKAMMRYGDAAYNFVN